MCTHDAVLFWSTSRWLGFTSAVNFRVVSRSLSKLLPGKLRGVWSRLVPIPRIRTWTDGVCPISSTFKFKVWCIRSLRLYTISYRQSVDFINLRKAAGFTKPRRRRRKGFLRFLRTLVELSLTRCCHLTSPPYFYSHSPVRRGDRLKSVCMCVYSK